MDSRAPLIHIARTRPRLCGMRRTGFGERGLVIPNKRAETGRSARKGLSLSGFTGKAESRRFRSSILAMATAFQIAGYDLRLFRLKRAPRNMDQRSPILSFSDKPGSGAKHPSRRCASPSIYLIFCFQLGLEAAQSIRQEDARCLPFLLNDFTFSNGE